MINWEDRKATVESVFSNVAEKYDIMNDLMSFGVQRLWKKHFTDLIVFSLKKELGENGGKNADVKFLDLACGSCDIAISVYKKMQKAILKSGKDGCSFSVTACDQNEDMLKSGMAKVIDCNLWSKEALNKGSNSATNYADGSDVIGDFSFIKASAEDLPFKSNTFNAVAVSFGVRNFTEIERSLKEIYRVLKDGGMFFCLEFSKVENPLLQKIYKFHSNKIIPKIARVVQKDDEPYRYLTESIERFLDKFQLKSEIMNSGFSFADFRPLSGGISCVHFAKK